MTTVVQVSDDGGDSWRDLDYTDFEITLGLHERQRVPEATVTTRTQQDITPGQPFRIQINGETRFRGETKSSGTVGRNGNVRLSAQHRFASLIGESVDITDIITDSDIIMEAALDDSSRGGEFTLQYEADFISLDEYEVENRDVGDVFADVMDRTGHVYWVEPSENTIRVQTRGGRGTWQTLVASEDGISIESYDDGSIETVVNDVTVTPTRGEADVTGEATDQDSIDEYGRRAESYNIAYAAEQDEADAVAESLLQPTPLAEGDIAIPQTVGDVDEPLVNFTLDVTDASKGIDVTDLIIEQQVIEQGRATVEGGEGRAQSIEDSNRKQRSDRDKTLPGFVVGERRIGDDAITRDKLVDGEVIEDKLADLSISETKIQDDSISTPKLQAEAVTADEILAGTITALEIEAGALTANEIDTLELNTDQLSIGADADSTIVFDIDDVSGTTVPRMRPSGDELATLGDSDRQFWIAHIRNMEISRSWIFEAGDAPQMNWSEGENADDEPSSVLIPGEAGSGALGKPLTWDPGAGNFQRPFEVVFAENFVEATPEPLDGVALDELGGYSWDQPPAYATQRKSGDGYRRENPRKGGLELGHMTNYLLETCKAQQERIDELEQRLSAVEEEL